MIATLQPSPKPCRIPCQNLDEEDPAAVIYNQPQQLLGSDVDTVPVKVPSAGEMAWNNRMSKPFFAVRDQIQDFSSSITLASYSLLDGNGYFGLLPIAAD